MHQGLPLPGIMPMAAAEEERKIHWQYVQIKDLEAYLKTARFTRASAADVRKLTSKTPLR
jgi:hypothetical protein